MDAGNLTPTLAVDGVPFAGSSATLAAGGDYTLLVHGTGGTPLASWIADDNRLPLTASAARVRLVNGVSGASAPLAMTIDFLPIADGVEVGRASAYDVAGAALKARVAVTAGSESLFVAPEQVIADGAVYSVFVLGAHDAATGVVRKDR